MWDDVDEREAAKVLARLLDCISEQRMVEMSGVLPDGAWYEHPQDGGPWHFQAEPGRITVIGSMDDGDALGPEPRVRLSAPLADAEARQLSEVVRREAAPSSIHKVEAYDVIVARMNALLAGRSRD